MEIIHIVLGKANPDRLNGVNKVVYQLATEQTKAGRNVALWGIAQDTTHDYPARNFKTLLFQKKRFPFALGDDLKAAVLANRDAVFHLHGGWIPVFSRLAAWMAKHGIKYVITPHGAYNPVAMQRSALRKSLYFHLFENRLLRHAHRVHSIGRSETSGLKQLAPSAHSFLLPYGFEPAAGIPGPTKNTAFTIGFVGRLDIHTKGLDLLLEAFARFQKAHPDSGLWIIGDGPGRPYLEKNIARLNLQHTVMWGKKFGKEKDELIAQMHVFAHPSRNEGLPTAVLEAASLGVPAIVSEATNTADFVFGFGAGIAIADENTDELLQAMHTLFQAYQNKTAVKYSSGARRMLQEAFSWPVLVEQYDALYQ